MKKVLFSVVLACSALGMQGTRVGDGYVPQRSDYKIRTEVTTTDDDGTIIYDRVITYLTDARNHTDTLQSEALPLDTADWSRQSFGEIMEQDFNFDGIPDLQIGTGPMNSYGNFTYDIFIWDEQAHRFVYLEDQPPLFVIPRSRLSASSDWVMMSKSSGINGRTVNWWRSARKPLITLN